MLTTRSRYTGMGGLEDARAMLSAGSIGLHCGIAKRHFVPDSGPENPTPHDRTRPFAALLGAFAWAWDLGAFLALDLESRRAPGTLPIRGSLATMSSQARSSASSKSGASA